MDVLDDVVKMVNTARGKEKMFEYESLLANRLYLTYLLGGKFCTDSTIRRQTKFTFIFFWMMGCSAGTFIFLSYLEYGDKNDFQLLLSIGYSTLIAVVTLVVEPLISVYFYGDNIMNAIKMVDHIVTKNGNREKLDNEINLERLAIWIVTAVLAPGVFFFFYLPIVMMLFYEPEKTKDFNYYLAYVPNVGEWGSLKYFFIFNISLDIAATASVFIWISLTIFVGMFAGFCHNEAQRMANDLNSLISEDITSIEMYKRKIEPKFRTILKKCMRDYQDLMQMLTEFQGFYTTFCGFTVPIVFVIELSHVINWILPGVSAIVRVREMAGSIMTVIQFFVFCWAGDILKEVAPTVSFAVYSLPWYWSTTHRKDVYILLCQTQVPTDQKAVGFYPIELKTFLRFLNTIQSTVNLLRAVAFK